MKIVDESRIDEKGYLTRWLIGPWNSQASFDFGIAFIQPKQYIKKHFHEKIEELFYVIEGEIQLLLSNKEEFTLKQGFVAHIPPKQVHGLHNRSNKIVKLVVVKSPSIPSDKKYVEK
ncbi:MAG: cupin domain-containing protein [Candidatus Helarchaeota archaeon]